MGVLFHPCLRRSRHFIYSNLLLFIFTTLFLTLSTSAAPTNFLKEKQEFNLTTTEESLIDVFNRTETNLRKETEPYFIRGMSDLLVENIDDTKNNDLLINESTTEEMIQNESTTTTTTASTKETANKFKKKLGNFVKKSFTKPLMKIQITTSTPPLSSSTITMMTTASTQSTTSILNGTEVDVPLQSKITFANKEVEIKRNELIQVELTTEQLFKEPEDDELILYPEIPDDDETTVKTTNLPKTTDFIEEINHDADTIFYISNTEVKVVESIPTPDSKKENQFYPAVYEEDVFIDFSNRNHTNRSLLPDKYEEDIILSPLKNFDPFKDENLSVSYVGESYIEIHEQLTTENQISSDVIIQPVIMPDLIIQPTQQSIGVPIIAELPPQIELKRLDYNDIVSHILVHPGADSLVSNSLSAAEVKEGESSPLLNGSGKKGEKLLQNRKNVNGSAGTDLNVNSTMFYMEEEESNGFSDIQTLFLACIATLVPLIFSVCLAFGVRCIWRKYRRDRAVGSGLIGDNSTDPLAAKSRTLSVDELKSSDSAYTINRSNDNLLSSSEMLSKYAGGTTVTKGNHTGANGSVITMTMKNNHLIVETEERNDIGRDTRETKMHYSPSEKDGVFVVEVSRGADTTGGVPICNGGGLHKGMERDTEALLEKQKEIKNEIIKIENNIPHGYSNIEKANHQEVQIHQPPVDEIIEIGEDGAISLNKIENSNTGLSQSDLSITSSNGSNQIGYSYGNQEPYSVDSNGYKSPPIPRPNIPTSLSKDELKMNGPVEILDPNRPVITAAIFKQDSIDPLSDNREPIRLLSDVQAEDQRKEDKLLEEQRLLGNGDVLFNGKEICDTIQENGDGFDSLAYLPDPPSSDEIKHLNEVLLENNNLDSLPPPPPEVIIDCPNGNVLNES